MLKWSLVICTVALWATGCLAIAQNGGRGPEGPGAAGGRGGGRGPTLVSPEIRPDRTVVLRLLAPKATEVTVIGEIMGVKPPVAMKKDEETGIWSVTLGPLEPEVYAYAFSVDGVLTSDPRNPYANPTTGTRSQVEVPGDGPQFYDQRPVPHGDVRIVAYESQVLSGMNRRLRVYTPPDYDAGNKKYPVLYLFHGANDWDVSWTDNERANLVMDNLIAGGKIKPMLVVMPAIFQQAAMGSGGVAGRIIRAGGVAPEAAASQPQDDIFTRELLQDIMPLINKKFRTLTGPDNTAIAGLSAGGAQTLRTGLAHLDTFHYVCGFSSAVGLGRGRGPDTGAAPTTASAPDPTASYPALMADIPGNNKKLKLLWISAGADDPLHVANKALADALSAKGVKLTYRETPGGHWIIVWRQNLRDIAPLLFR